MFQEKIKFFSFIAKEQICIYPYKTYVIYENYKKKLTACQK